MSFLINATVVVPFTHLEEILVASTGGCFRGYMSGHLISHPLFAIPTPTRKSSKKGQSIKEGEAGPYNKAHDFRTNSEEFNLSISGTTQCHRGWISRGALPRNKINILVLEGLLDI